MPAAEVFVVRCFAAAPLSMTFSTIIRECHGERSEASQLRKLLRQRLQDGVGEEGIVEIGAIAGLFPGNWL